MECVIYLFSPLQTPSTLGWPLSAECLLFKGWLLARANLSPEEVNGNLPLDLRMLWIETQSSTLHVPIELSRVSGCARKEPLVLQLLSVNISHQSKYKQWAFPHLVIKYSSLFSATFCVKGSPLFWFSINDHIWEASLEEGTIIPSYQHDVRMYFLNMAVGSQSLVSGFYIVSSINKLSSS